MAILGLRGTGDWGTDERPKNFREMILWAKPNGTSPLFAMTSKVGKKTTDDPEFSWWEEVMTIGRIQINGAVLIGGTTITVNNGLNGMTAQDLKPGDLLLVEEGAETTGYGYEIVEVASITSATQFVVTRGAAGSTATAISDDTWLTLLTSAYEEGSAKPTATTRNPTKFYNYTQIFKDGYSITGTAKQTTSRTGDPLVNDKKRKMHDHARSLELALLFGKRYEGTGSGGKPKRFTGGLLYFLAAASRVDVATAMVGTDGIDGLLDILTDVFDLSGTTSMSGDERLILCGNSAATAISKAVAKRGDINFGEMVKVYGMNVTRLTIPQGSFYIKTHPLMNAHARFTKAAFVVDVPGIKYRPLRNRDTMPVNDTQTPGTDAQEGHWLTEGGFEFNFMQSMKYLAEITYAAS